MQVTKLITSNKHSAHIEGS